MPWTALSFDDPPAPTPAWLHAGRIPALDGLRAIAVLLVLTAHVGTTTSATLWPGVRTAAGQAAIGVDLFFVISGFLITTLMLREVDRTGGLDLRNFFVRRVLRIFPAYYVFLAVVYLLTRLDLASVPAGDWLAAVTYTVNFRAYPAWEVGHTWSLSVEEHFYLAWPFVIAYFSRRTALGVAAGVVVFGFLARWVVLLWWPELSVYLDSVTFTRIDTILFGCVLAILVRRVEAAASLGRLVRRRRFLGLGLLLLLASLAAGGVSGKYLQGIGMTANAVALTVLLWGVLLRADAGRFRWLEHPWLTAIGVRSYSIYLWQQLFLHPGSGPLRTFPWNALLAVAAGFVSYAVIERPLLSLRSRVRRGGSDPAGEAAAVNRPRELLPPPADLRSRTSRAGSPDC